MLTRFRPSGCKTRFSALPLLTYLKVRCAAVLENHAFRRDIQNRETTANSCRARGFTLIEFSVVLAVIGLLLGAIWVTATTVSENNGVNHVNRQVIEVVQNIRDQYANTQFPPGWTPGGNITQSRLGLFPAEMQRAGGTYADHALYDTSDPISYNAGSFRVFATSSTASTAPVSIATPACIANSTNSSVGCFRIMLLGLHSSACIKLLEGLPLNDQAMGIVQVGVYNFATAVTSTSQACSGTPCITPSIPLATAASWCSGSTSNDNSYVLFVDFKLHS